MYIEGASLNAVSHDYLMLWVNIVTVLCFIVLNSVLVYFIIRYRKRSDHDITSRLDNNKTLEVIWTVIPTIVMVWLYAWGLIVFIESRTVPQNAMQINVRAQQWAWEFIYPSELRQNPNKATTLKSSNILYLEEGRATKLVMKSTDVIHSFFIPAFRLKEDVVPNMYTYMAFKPSLPLSKKGTERVEYDIFCTEYCGKDHSAMLGKAVVLSPKKFRKEMTRIEIEAGNITPERGKTIYNGNCKSCHTLDGSALLGPSFQGLWQKEREIADGTKVIADENYIRKSILNPSSQVVKGYPAAMPVQNYNDAEIQSIIEYIKNIQ